MSNSKLFDKLLANIPFETTLETRIYCELVVLLGNDYKELLEKDNAKLFEYAEIIKDSIMDLFKDDRYNLDEMLKKVNKNNIYEETK